MPPPYKKYRCKFFGYDGQPVHGGCPRTSASCRFIHPNEPSWDDTLQERYGRDPSPYRGYSPGRRRDGRDSTYDDRDRDRDRRRGRSAEGSSLSPRRTPSPKRHRLPTRSSRSPRRHPSPLRASRSDWSPAGPSRHRHRGDSISSSRRSEGSPARPESGTSPSKTSDIVKHPRTPISATPQTPVRFVASPTMPQDANSPYPPPPAGPAPPLSSPPGPPPSDSAGLPPLRLVIPPPPAKPAGLTDPLPTATSAIFGPVSAPFHPEPTPLTAKPIFPSLSKPSVTSATQPPTSYELELADEHLKNLARATQIRHELCDNDRDAREARIWIDRLGACYGLSGSAQTAVETRIKNLEQQKMALRNEYTALNAKLATSLPRVNLAEWDAQRTQVGAATERISALCSMFSDVTALLPSGHEPEEPPPKYTAAQIEERVAARREFDMLADNLHYVETQHHHQGDALQRRMEDLSLGMQSLHADPEIEKKMFNELLERTLAEEHRFNQLDADVQAMQMQQNAAVTQLQAIRAENQAMRERLDKLPEEPPITLEVADSLRTELETLQQAVFHLLQAQPPSSFSAQQSFGALLEPVKQTVMGAVNEQLQSHTAMFDASLVQHDAKWTEDVANRVQRTLELIQGVDTWSRVGQSAANGVAH